MTYGLKEAHDELMSELEDLRDENARLRSCLSEDEENARLIIGEYNELQAKYAEVCETSAMLRADMAAARERQAKLREENAKLRELARQMAYAISPTSREHMLVNLAEMGIEVG